MVKVLNDLNFDSEVSKGVTLVDFYADWCGPCKMMAPVIENISEEISSLNVCKLNVDEANKIAKKYNIMSIPTFMLFKDGDVVETFKGAIPKDIITSKLKNYIV